MMISKPYISIIFVIGTQRERSQQALVNILEQKGIENAEVLIFDTAFDQYPALAGSHHPSVHIHEVKGSLSLSNLRLKAVEAGRGEIIAFTEDHAYVIPGWLESLTRGFEAGHGGVGSVPQVKNPGMGISDAVNIINFGFFPPITKPCTYYMLPGHNSAYRRDILLSFGDLLPILITTEVLLNSKMTENGFTLLLDPQAGYFHQNEESVAMVTKAYYYSNLCFGASRAELFGWRWWRRALQLLSTPLVPFVRYLKYMVYFWRHNRSNLPILFRYTAVFFYTQSIAAIGLAIGCVFGAGNGEKNFLHYELNTSRSIQHS